MARPERDPRARPDRPGQKPLLQGHLRPGGAREGSGSFADPGAEAESAAHGQPSPQPASDVAESAADAVRGKATRSPAEVAKRRNLEGSEQGPA